MIVLCPPPEKGERTIIRNLWNATTVMEARQAVKYEQKEERLRTKLKLAKEQTEDADGEAEDSDENENE